MHTFVEFESSGPFPGLLEQRGVPSLPKSDCVPSYVGDPSGRDPLALARALLAHAKTARNPGPLIEAADALLAEMDQGDSAPAAG